MSGHSKWSTIKRQKGAKDAARGAVFTKLGNAIAIAARGGADPDMNFSLRLAIQKAKAANMPAANIERSIKRGSGQLGGAVMEEITYEGYGPGGVAIMIAVATDNRNRTAAEVRSTLTKHGGHLGETGSVAYQFKPQGVITLATDDLEKATLEAIEAGAEDIDEGQGEITVYTAPTQLDAVRTKLAGAGYEIKEAALSFEPQTTVKITDAKTAQTLMKIMDMLDNLEDVTETYANFELDDTIIEEHS